MLSRNQNHELNMNSLSPTPAPAYQTHPIQQTIIHQHLDGSKSNVSLKKFTILNALVVIILIITVVLYVSSVSNHSNNYQIHTANVIVSFYLIEILSAIQCLIYFNMFYTRERAKIFYRVFLLSLSTFALLAHTGSKDILDNGFSICGLVISLTIYPLVFFFPIDADK